MRKLILAVLACLAALPAAAQQPTLPSNTVLGRLGVTPGPAQAIPFSTLAANLTLQSLSGPGSSTPGHIAIWNDTAGLALTDLAVLPVANGGTNCSGASGACIDNLSGWASTGFINRTGAGSYTFSPTIPVDSGGTNCSVASGTCLDNITAFSSTGLMRRTGAGTYTFGTTVAVTEGGTGAGTWTTNLPLIGAGTSALTQGTKTGTTTLFATFTGTATSGDCVSIDANGNLIAAGGACTTGGGGGTVSAGTIGNLASYTGATTVAGNANLNISSGALTLGLAGSVVGQVKLANATSGNVTLSPPAGALGTPTLTVPAATDTLIGKATTDVLTNKTYDTAGSGNVFSINGVAATANTGTGSVVRATTPTLVTPVLGVATGTGITLGTNGGTGGTVVLNGSTSGAATLQVAAAAGTTTFQLPSTSGSNGQTLTTNGAGVLSWTSSAGTMTSLNCGTNNGSVGGGSAAITTTGTCDNGVLLEILTASNSASLTTAATLGSYRRIQIVFDRYLAQTDDTTCRIRVNVAGVQTTTYLARIYIDGSTEQPTTHIPCSFATATFGLSNAAGDGGMSGEIWLTAPSSTTGKKVFRGNVAYIVSGAVLRSGVVGGVWNGGNGAITALEFTQDSGNITSGTVSIYGWN